MAFANKPRGGGRVIRSDTKEKWSREQLCTYCQPMHAKGACPHCGQSHSYRDPEEANEVPTNI